MQPEVSLILFVSYLILNETNLVQFPSLSCSSHGILAWVVQTSRGQ